MKTYIALLRGINVGGKNIIKMADLILRFEEIGFFQVRTYIQSGNVIFASEISDPHIIEEMVEKKLGVKAVIRSEKEMAQVVKNVPEDWNLRDDIRCYIAFIKKPMMATEAAKEIKLKAEVDFLKIGSGVLYMTTLLSGLTKSGFSKIVGTSVYQYLTIRNYNTIKKILELMGKLE